MRKPMVDIMFMGRSSSLVGALCFVLGGADKASSSAPEPTAPVSPARPFHEAAMKAYHAGEYATALELERRANTVEPSPVYLYQIGRALEALGRLYEAYQSYLTARANLDGHPHTSDDLRALVAGAIDGLAPLQDRGQIRVSGLTREAMVQIDDRMLPLGESDVVVSPGEHLICFTERAARWSACLLREVAQGRRVTVAMPGDPAALARLSIEDAPRFTRVRIDGRLLLVELDGLGSLVLEPGTYEIALERPAGTIDTITFELVGGDVRPLDLLPALRSPTSTPSPTRVAPWVVIGAGAALLIASGFLLVSADDEERALEGASKNALGQFTGITQRDSFERWDDAGNLRAWGLGLGAAGLGSLIGGLVWLAVDGTDAPPASTEVRR